MEALENRKKLELDKGFLIKEEEVFDSIIQKSCQNFN